MSEVFVVIKIEDSARDFQYALEIEKGNIEQLAMLNAMIDIAKATVVKEIDKKTSEGQ